MAAHPVSIAIIRGHTALSLTHILHLRKHSSIIDILHIYHQTQRKIDRYANNFLYKSITNVRVCIDQPGYKMKKGAAKNNRPMPIKQTVPQYLSSLKNGKKTEGKREELVKRSKTELHHYIRAIKRVPLILAALSHSKLDRNQLIKTTLIKLK